ncbi:hypothetical protein C8F01DRAFT_1362261 [Mycena amicta]|nr:hypothetical protein C8F01DRAFT_1362261 [Mycena amicta]
MLASPFIDILHTNVVPSEAQCDEIRAYVLEEEAKLSEAAVHKRTELRELFDAHLALISPMRRVPDDVLRVVFLFAIPHVNPRRIAPLLLSHVSQRWRQVAFTTPHLWAAIVISADVDERKVQAVKSGIISWVERSGIVPLDLLLYLCRGRYALPGNRPATELLRPLVSISQRWKSIRLSLSPADDLSALSQLTATDVPQLQRVDISLLDQLSDRAPAAAGIHNALNFLQSKVLQSFSFEGTRFIPTSVSWTTLLHLELTLEGHRLDTIPFPPSCLAECNRLQTLKIRLVGYQVDIPTTGETILLSDLTEVRLDLDHPHISLERQIFESIHAPALRSLELFGVVSNFTRFFRTTPSLTYLRFGPSTTDELVVALDALPLLEELRIQGEPRLGPGTLDGSVSQTRVDDNFLAVLTPSTTSRPRCRELRSLHLERVVALPDSLIVQFVKERTLDAAVHGVARLKHFRCFVRREEQLDITQELKDAVADGLFLDVCY